MPNAGLAHARTRRSAVLVAALVAVLVAATVVARPWSTDAEGTTPTTGEDVVLSKPTVRYDSHCDCTVVTVRWQADRDLENGWDAVVVHADETVTMLGGSVIVCDAGPAPDRCRTHGVQLEASTGVGQTFASEEGEHGTISMSVRDYTGVEGRCPLTIHYAHGGTDDRIHPDIRPGKVRFRSKADFWRTEESYRPAC
ncbi:hypothetical protein CLV30_11394 [Haloactinopolyspora alba]|uniref:Uncharacterized protein n=1 Tax=Haloactinopolyspora alba TaxID=648780 RepID=A0A2P8DWK2_9ACTN|nr:hypothetical protein [Haloactinopolyspora alba]PSL01606.1 hypothetical protein CLV30_11394 [Haloactinopolyspora alba]